MSSEPERSRDRTSASVDAGREQAPARHHAVPNPSQLGDYCLYRPILASHSDT